MTEKLHGALVLIGLALLSWKVCTDKSRHRGSARAGRGLLILWKPFLIVISMLPTWTARRRRRRRLQSHSSLGPRSETIPGFSHCSFSLRSGALCGPSVRSHSPSLQPEYCTDSNTVGWFCCVCRFIWKYCRWSVFLTSLSLPYSNTRSILSIIFQITLSNTSFQPPCSSLAPSGLCPTSLALPLSGLS